ncbi:MAG TPA: hypothetical protein VJB87_02325 [Candidatus Nanoarchaeia archaeon]|nr:hypothetical protein [Candidatus Nanoarchaeia archaeon]
MSLTTILQTDGDTFTTRHYLGGQRLCECILELAETTTNGTRKRYETLAAAVNTHLPAKR